MKESEVLQLVRLALQKMKCTNFRNNVGNGFQGIPLTLADGTIVLKKPRRIRFGLCEGSSDIIGFTEHTISESDIGRKVAIFTAIETKHSYGRARVTPEQVTFLNRVRDAGGIAGVVKSPIELEAIFKAWGLR